MAWGEIRHVFYAWKFADQTHGVLYFWQGESHFEEGWEVQPLLVSKRIMLVSCILAQCDIEKLPFKDD